MTNKVIFAVYFVHGQVKNMEIPHHWRLQPNVEYSEKIVPSTCMFQKCERLVLSCTEKSHKLPLKPTVAVTAIVPAILLNWNTSSARETKTVIMYSHMQNGDNSKVYNYSVHYC